MSVARQLKKFYIVLIKLFKMVEKFIFLCYDIYVTKIRRTYKINCEFVGFKFF